MSAIMFGVSSLIGAITMIFSPETFLKKLPENIEDAKNL